MSATRELLECEIVIGLIKSAKGGGRDTFKSKVSRLLRLGYKPLGNPHYPPDGKNAVLTLTIAIPPKDQ